MKETDYDELCNKYSNKILQRIICPNCGYVYSDEESIDLGVSSDCEDEVYIDCKKCGTRLKVDSWCTEVRFSTQIANKEQE